MKNAHIAAFFAVLSAVCWFLLQDFSVRNYVSLLFALFALQVILNDLLESYLVSKLKSKYFNLVIAPGTIVHEASHALVAKLTGCDITKISFFNYSKKNGGVLGFVEYAQPADGHQSIRSLLIGIAPFFGCGIFLIAILNYLALSNPELGLVGPSLVEIGDADKIISSINLILARFYEQLLFLDLSNPAILFLLYLEFSFALGSAPSPKDISGAFDSLLENKLEAFSIALFVLSAVLVIEYAPQLWDQGDKISQPALAGLKWIILILMISLVMLLVAMPLSYVISENAEIRGIVKVIPPLLFLLAYFLMTRFLEMSAEIVLLSSAVVYLVPLFVLRHPEYFLKD
jgi:hypothetical protein